ncbi:MAG TPA: chromosome segregation protein SMC, partial [Candidatus Binataceae bacterium]|nr:chromosome segregation protein SMC [Candidatus Binataceae bacterium]
PSRLRGKSAEDLIYAGNDSNPAAGMAEVSLILEASQEAPFPGPYSTLAEMAITRRVFRGGDSEYLINKIPCRLKDITEFFMAIQIHSRSFAIVEQGRVDEIIQSKPHEIRSMIEEAAGLSLFKGRRELSERKLERVKENLARVDDVLAEIERQLNYARRQAKKAEAFKAVKAELTELERLQSGRRILERREEYADESSRETELRAGADSVRAILDECQAALAAASEGLKAAENDLGAARRERDDLASRAAERSRTRDFLTRRLEAIREAHPGHLAKIAELEGQAAVARARRAAAGAALAREANAGDGGAEAQLVAIRHEHSARQAEATSLERTAEDLKDELSEVVREAAAIRGRLGDLTGERADLQARSASEEQAEPALAEMARQTAVASEDAAKSLASLRVELPAREAAYHEISHAESETRSSLEQLSARIKALDEAVREARPRPRAPETRGGVDARLRTVLESLNGDRPRVDPRPVASVMRAPAVLEPALKAALGVEYDAVIVDSPVFAVRAIDILKERHAGRMAFVPEPEGGLSAVHESLEAPGIAGRLIDMLEVEPRFRPVAEAMLGHVMLADDVRSALAASNLNGHGTLFVTRDGDIVEPGKMICGGSVDATNAPRTESIQPLKETSAHLARARVEREALEMILPERIAAKERAARILAELRARIADGERVANTARSEAASAEQTMRMATIRLVESRRRLDEIASLIATSNTRLEELALAEQNMRQKLAEMREQIGTSRQTVEQIAAKMLEIASKVEARRAEIASFEKELHHASESARNFETQIDESRARLTREAAEQAEFEAELDKLAAQDADARVRETALSEMFAILERECAERGRDLESHRTRHKDAQTRLHALEDEAMQCALRRERARTLSEESVRIFAEKFGADFDAVAEELCAAIAMRDGATDDNRIAELRAKAERIGEVNLAADSEVKELEERSTALGAERADLDAAVKDLTATITKLNREARKRFAETFEGAARNFEQVFPKLLPGGKGRLELEQSDDVLEAGVSILIQPAGKKVKEIALLSGGEKALSAMALIFSLFLLNPSPFCVMDEVDAPLDEFRLHAFTALLAELKARSQFIVITHNQRTMQKADHIHGITMDRPGVSRVISLKIPQAA